jgi:hypothetical protein
MALRTMNAVQNGYAMTDAFVAVFKAKPARIFAWRSLPFRPRLIEVLITYSAMSSTAVKS